jgi:hypothetical protein
VKPPVNIGHVRDQNGRRINWEGQILQTCIFANVQERCR